MVAAQARHGAACDAGIRAAGRADRSAHRRANISAERAGLEAAVTVALAMPQKVTAMRRACARNARTSTKGVIPR